MTYYLYSNPTYLLIHTTTSELNAIFYQLPTCKTRVSCYYSSSESQRYSFGTDPYLNTIVIRTKMPTTHLQILPVSLLSRLSATVLMLLILQFSSEANAEEKIHFGIDGAVVIPMGDWSEIANLGLGLLARAEYNYSKSLTFTARAGYVRHFHEEYHNITQYTSELIIFGGVKYFFFGDNKGVFASGEAGVVNFWQVTNENFLGIEQQSEDSDIQFSFAIGGGYRLKRFEFAFSLFVPTVDKIEHRVGLMLTFGGIFISL